MVPQCNWDSQGRWFPHVICILEDYVLCIAFWGNNSMALLSSGFVLSLFVQDFSSLVVVVGNPSFLDREIYRWSFKDDSTLLIGINFLGVYSLV